MKERAFCSNCFQREEEAGTVDPFSPCSTIKNDAKYAYNQPTMPREGAEWGA